MKIVDRETFLTMEPGTLFAKYEPHFAGDLMIFEGRAGTDDFVVQPLIDWPEDCTSSDDYFTAMDQAIQGVQTAPMDFTGTMRDGLFDKDQLFLIFTPLEKQRLIDRLGT